MPRQMKESGIEWMGQIPNDWEVWRLKHLLDSPLMYGANESGIPYDANLPRYIRITDITIDGKLKDTGKLSLERDVASAYLLKTNDILFARSGATVGKAFIYKEEYGHSAFAGYLIKCSVCEGINPYFLFLYTQSSAYEEWKNQIFVQATIQNIGADKYSNLPIPLPCKKEQDRVVSFLTEYCANIDAILEQTRNSVEEYKKLKQAVITQAVTKGVCSNSSMKDSGSVWFGAIPERWNMKKLKYVFSIKKDIAGAEGYTILSITQKGIVPKDISKNEGQLAANYSNYQLVNPGDFAMNHMDLLTGWVDISKYSGVTSPDYRVFFLNDPENNCDRYYLYMMQMCYSNKIFYGLGQGVSGLGRWRLQADKFLNFEITVPPIEEQVAIANYLDEKCSAIDMLIEKKQQVLLELEKYKKSMIYEYVTGKKEVPQL